MSIYVQSIPLARDPAVDLEATQAEAVGPVRVLAQLYHSKEPIAICSNLRVNCGIYHESERTTLQSEIFVFVVQSLLSVIERVSLVNADVEDVPVDTICRCFKLPVTQDVSQLISIAQRVVGWANTTVLADINTHETECLILSPAVLCTAANEAVDQATLSHRAAKGGDEAERMWVLPQSAAAQRSKIVQGTLFIEVVIEEELSWDRNRRVRIENRISACELSLCCAATHCLNWATLISGQVGHVLQGSKILFLGHASGSHDSFSNAANG